MTREEEIKLYLKERNIPIDSLEANSIIEGAQWADKTMIDKAYKWLADNIDYILRFYTEGDRDKVLKDFKIAMEE